MVEGKGVMQAIGTLLMLCMSRHNRPRIYSLSPQPLASCQSDYAYI